MLVNRLLMEVTRTQHSRGGRTVLTHRWWFSVRVMMKSRDTRKISLRALRDLCELCGKSSLPQRPRSMRQGRKVAHYPHTLSRLEMLSERYNLWALVSSVNSEPDYARSSALLPLTTCQEHLKLKAVCNSHPSCGRFP